ncbi:very short patch repair endonuclease [Rhizobium leguminosarum]|uniref:very short patch repair endonuclease n=1 Tax=Rhizobium leguminosarum TaxID=384 RepID=UPI003F9822C4
MSDKARDFSTRYACNLDRLTPEQRSYNMSRIRGRDTGPELALRRAIHSLGLRYRLHVKSLPGTPDIVFPSRRAVILVNGCFWHGHNCPKGVTPKTNTSFWLEKIERTRLRDQLSDAALRGNNWRILKVWECALRGRARLDIKDLANEVEEWLKASTADLEIVGAWTTDEFTSL